jgi:hypothetical protein
VGNHGITGEIVDFRGEKRDFGGDGEPKSELFLNGTKRKISDLFTF